MLGSGFTSLDLDHQADAVIKSHRNVSGCGRAIFKENCNIIVCYTSIPGGHNNIIIAAIWSHCSRSIGSRIGRRGISESVEGHCSVAVISSVIAGVKGATKLHNTSKGIDYIIGSRHAVFNNNGQDLAPSIIGNSGTGTHRVACIKYFNNHTVILFTV